MIKSFLLPVNAVAFMRDPPTHTIVIDDIKYEYQLTYIRKNDLFQLHISAEDNKCILDLTCIYGTVSVNDITVQDSSGIELAITMIRFGTKVLYLSGLTYPKAKIEIHLPKGNNETIHRVLKGWGFDEINRSTVGEQMRFIDDKLKLKPGNAAPDKFVVQGPVSGYKLTDLTTNTQMLIFGDRHEIFENSQNCGEIPWYHWLQNIVEPSIPEGARVDVFLEAPLIMDQGQKRPTVATPLFFQGHLFGSTNNALRDRLQQQDSQNGRMRIHPIDTRFLPTLPQLVNEWLNTDARSIDDLTLIFGTMYPDQLFSSNQLRDNRHWIKFVKGLREQMGIDMTWIQGNSVFARLLKQDTEDQINIAIKSIDLKTFSKEVQTLHSLILDEYVMYRASGSGFYIMYLGDFHVQHIVTVLLKCNFGVSSNYFGHSPNELEGLYKRTKRPLKAKHLSQCNDFIPLMPFFKYNTSKRKR